ncbi:hypothetical protein [Desulfovibrio sp. SGI.169]|uniref:hypothetical protein n=1 Tax=Desulfovibrio sp. SGI.169 TaxID=3420561 RepID=UPI003CFEBD92
MDITTLPSLDMPLTHKRGDKLYVVNPRTTGAQVILSDGGNVEDALMVKSDPVALFEAALGDSATTIQPQE